MATKIQTSYSLGEAASVLLDENGWTLERATGENILIYKKGDCTLAVDTFWTSRMALSPPPTTYHIRMYTAGIDVPDPQTDGYSYMNLTQFAAWVGQTPVWLK